MNIDIETVYPIVVLISTRAGVLDRGQEHLIMVLMAHYTGARLFYSSRFFFTSGVDVLALRAEIHTRRYTTRFSVYSAHTF